jgi:hypothetical protein
VTPDAQILVLEERARRLQRTLECILARSYSWGVLSAGEYYKQGQKKAWTEISLLAEAGIRWANGDEPDGPE